MKEEELKYMLCLLEGLTPEIYNEIHLIYDAIGRSTPVNSISDFVLHFFKLNLKNNPVTTCEVLKDIQDHLKLIQTQNSDLQKIHTLFMEVLESEIIENRSDKLVTLLSLAKYDNNYLPKYTSQILKLISIDTFTQHHKQILMSLVPQDQPGLIHSVTNTIHNNELQKDFKLTAEYMIELCYEEKIHWLLKAAQIYKQQLHDMKTVTFEINNFTKQLLIMVLIDLTNCPETYDLNSLVNQLTNIFSILDTYNSNDKQLQFYLTEVKRELTLIKFCLENNCKIMTTSIFNQVLMQSALTVISRVCRLSKVDRYKVTQLLNMNNDYISELKVLSNKPDNKTCKTSSNWDISVYISYCTITKVIDTILDVSDSMANPELVTNSMEDIKRLVLSIQPLQCCLEVIENIFSCLFLRFEYFSCYEHNQEFPCGTHSECSYFYSKKQSKTSKSVNSSNSGFMCNSVITQVVLETLKVCLESLSDKREVINCSDAGSLF